MSLTDFFSPINPESFTPKRGFLTSQLGLRAQIYTETFPDLTEETFDLAIFGVLDGKKCC